jgi:hypothetical protein
MSDYQPGLPLHYSPEGLFQLIEELRRELHRHQRETAALKRRVTDLEEIVYDEDDDINDADYDPASHCADCGTETTPAALKDWQWYIVDDQVLADAGMNGGYLCIGCLEKRLGRPLTGADFDPDIPINCPGAYPDTERLAELKREAAR